MLICHCSVVSDRRVRQAITDGATDLLDVASATGAGAFCGGCQPAIAGILAEATHETPSELVARGPATVAGRRTERRPVQAVVRALEEDIVGGGWTRSRELGSLDELAIRYGTTRGVLKSALGVLEHHGIIASERGGTGAVMTGVPDVDAIADAGVLHLLATGVTVGELMDARRTVESEVARRAVARVDSSTLETLRESVDAAPGRTLTRDYSDFHEQFGRATSNPVLALFADLLTRLARDHAAAGLDTRSLGRQRSAGEAVAQEHRRIVDELASGDPDAAVGAALDHLASQETWFESPHTRFVVATSDAAVPMAVARDVAVEIARRGLAPGDEVCSRHDLAARHGVQADVVRDAAALLEYYSVATLLPGPEATIAASHTDPWPAAQLIALHLDRVGATVQHIREALDPLELQATEMATRAMTDDGADRLRRRLREESLAIQRDGVTGDPFRFSVNHNIHPLIAALSGNRVLTLLASACNLALVRAVAAAGGTRGRRTSDDERLVAVHTDLVETMITGDVTGACELMAEHLHGDSEVDGVKPISDPRTPPG